MREYSIRSAARLCLSVIKSFVTAVAAVCIVTLMQSDSHCDLLTDGDFDNLEVGTAPNEFEPAGGWAFVPEPNTEVDEENFQIVKTAEFDSKVKSGNSLRVRSSAGSNEHLSIELSPMLESDDTIIRANFDVFLPEGIPRGDAAIFLGGKLGDGWGRGPQVRWDREGKIYAAICDAADCPSPPPREYLVEEYESNDWQHVQMDIDLRSDSFDFYHASQGEPLAFIASNVGFRHSELDTIEFLNVTSFSNSLDGGIFYLDNVGVTALARGAFGDFDHDDTLNVTDLEILTSAIQTGTTDTKFDLNGSGAVDHNDQKHWVTEIKRTWLGDSNLDGQFNSGDFVQVFAAGQYEDDVVGNSTWATGDWNFDGEFNSSDFVTVFAGGGYDVGIRTASAVPEPATCFLLPILPMLLAMHRRRNRLN